MMKEAHRPHKATYLFSFITLIYLITKWITFKGFNGTDDLHYTMLASNSLKGIYNPFAEGDIFAGRILLIYWQAFIYFIAGINVFTTQLPTILITILCCYLTIFRLGQFKNTGSVIIASSLFYFNPVLNEATLGVMPDVYVMLAGIIILLVWKSILNERSKPAFIFKCILIGIIALAGMFFKENALILIPFIALTGIFHKKRRGIKAAAISIASFGLGVLFCGLIYHHFTGDFFFRLHQIQNSSYLNPCNYALLPQKELLIRLTYGVWMEFITSNFYPVILASFIILLRLVFDKNFKIKTQSFVVYFIMFLLLGLYFPFSFNDYQPLCFRARHFIFLYPPAVIIVAQFLGEALERNKKLLIHFLIGSFFLLIACIMGSGEKWYWMMYGFFFVYFLLLLVFRNTFISKLKYTGFAFALWIYMPYHFFFPDNDWFKNLQSLSTQLNGNYFYFPEHDNMSHFKLLHHYDTLYHIYNIEQKPFKIFESYYEKPGRIFHPGWLIVDNVYTLRSPSFLKTIKALDGENYFAAKKIVGEVSAYYIANSTQYQYIKKLTAADGSDENNCCN